MNGNIQSTEHKLQVEENIKDKSVPDFNRITDQNGISWSYKSGYAASMNSLVFQQMFE